MDNVDVFFCVDDMEKGHELRDCILENDLMRAQKVLGKESCNVNECDNIGRSLLHIAACRGNPRIIRLLLEKGATVNKVDNHGNTPLHWCGHFESVEHLVEFGGNVKSCNAVGLTPRQLAMRRGVDKDVINLFKLLEKCNPVLKRRECIATNRFTTLPSIWHEFYCDIGGKNIALLIVGLLAFSLYIAYIITGFHWNSQDQIPLDSHSYKIKL